MYLCVPFVSLSSLLVGFHQSASLYRFWPNIYRWFLSLWFSLSFVPKCVAACTDIVTTYIQYHRKVHHAACLYLRLGPSSVLTWFPTRDKSSIIQSNSFKYTDTRTLNVKISKSNHIVNGVRTGYWTFLIVKSNLLLGIVR